MKISFVIPAHNEERTIGRCLEAVGKELAREKCDPSTGLRVDAEVVVVNNASTDGTREAALRFPGVRVVDEPRLGLPRARKAGFEATTGELVANIDSDTMPPPGWLSTVLREFERDPKLVALSGPFIYYDLSAFSRALVKVFYFFGWLSYLFNQYVLHVGAMLQGGNFVIRRDAMERAGGFDTTIQFYGEDTDVARRLSKVGRVEWTWALPMRASGRRLAKEGIVRVGLRYAANFFSTTFFKRPVTAGYTEVGLEEAKLHDGR